MSSYLREKLDSTSWGEKIRELREENGWSQRDLAERLGVHHSTVSEIERGRTQFTLERLNRIVEALGYRATVELESIDEETRAEWGPILAEDPELRRRIRDGRRLVETLAGELYRKYDVSSVYCFGSLGEHGGEHFGKNSDVDLLVEGLEPSKLFEAESHLDFDVIESSDDFGRFGFDLVRVEDVDLDPDELVTNGEAILLPED